MRAKQSRMVARVCDLFSNCFFWKGEWKLWNFKDLQHGRDLKDLQGSCIFEWSWPARVVRAHGIFRAAGKSLRSCVLKSRSASPEFGRSIGCLAAVALVCVKQIYFVVLTVVLAVLCFEFFLGEQKVRKRSPKFRRRIARIRAMISSSGVCFKDLNKPIFHFLNERMMQWIDGAAMNSYEIKSNSKPICLWSHPGVTALAFVKQYKYVWHGVTASFIFSQ